LIQGQKPSPFRNFPSFRSSDLKSCKNDLR
jgi:hypothetical protein